MVSDARENFRKEVDFYVKPVFDRAAIAEKGAIDFALSSVKISCLLNGGALIAMQTVIQMFEINSHAFRSELILIGTVFSGGFLLSVIAMLLGFHALAASSDFQFVEANIFRDKFNINFNPLNPEVVNIKERVTKNEKYAAKKVKAFRCFRLWAILLMWTGIFLFFVGAELGGLVIFDVHIRNVL